MSMRDLWRAKYHRRTDPACGQHHGRTPKRSRGKGCEVCFPPMHLLKFPTLDKIIKDLERLTR